MMHRILVIDDNPAIHNDIRKILARPDAGATSLEDAETLLFGQNVEEDKRIYFDIDSAFQGQEGLELVKRALARAAGNVSQAALLLGINRTKVYRILSQSRESDGITAT